MVPQSRLPEGATRCIVRRPSDSFSPRHTGEQCNKWHPDRGHLRAPDAASDHAGRSRSPGRAGYGIVSERPSGTAALSTQCRYRATLAAGRSGEVPPAANEAVGVPSAWSQFFNHPPRDHADGATLGRLRAGGGPEGRGSRTRTRGFFRLTTYDSRLAEKTPGPKARRLS